MIILNRYHLTKRKQVSSWMEILSVLIAVLLSILVSAALITTSGANPIQAIQALFIGAFGTVDALTETIVQATPLMFTGLAVLVAFRAKIWNIGVEGQFWAGAIACTAVGLFLPDLPAPLLWLISCLAAMVAGALWGMIPALLKNRFNANVIIVTIMLNYVIQYIISFMVSGMWRDPEQFYIQTQRFAANTFFPSFFNSRIHLGLFIALFLVVIIYVLIKKTSLGFQIRAIGDNPTASLYKGINVPMIVMIVMMISGAIGGLAGASELSGLHHRLKLDISSGFGFTGILIAMLGRLNPFGVVLAAVFFGALTNGSNTMQIFTGVPVALIPCIQGIVLVFVLIAEIAVKYRIEKVGPC